MDQPLDVDFGLLQPSASKGWWGIRRLLNSRRKRRPRRGDRRELYLSVNFVEVVVHVPRGTSAWMGASEPALGQPATNRMMASTQQHKMLCLVGPRKQIPNNSQNYSHDGGHWRTEADLG